MMRRRVRRAVLWCAARERRWFVLALVVAFALRLAWIVWATAAPIESTSDTGRNLVMATQFSRFEAYRLYGHVTAFNAPGLPLVLAPVGLFVRATGWSSLPFAAALVNLVAGTSVVAAGGMLAGQWFDARARTVTAWILAVAVGPILLTSVALSETVFTALVLALLVILTQLLHGERRPSAPVLVGIGLLCGFTALVRPPGLVMVVVAGLVLVRLFASWPRGARATLVILLGAMSVLIPWTVRNGVQVGVWTPVSTNSAAFLCQGHNARAVAEIDDITDQQLAYCFRGSPFDPDRPDEAAWAPRVTRRALGWAITHPVEELRLTRDKTFALFESDGQAVSDARDGNRRDFASEDTFARLRRWAEVWHRAVLLLGLLALAILPRARRAWPLWLVAATQVVAAWGGSVLDRYHHTTMAILAVFAGALLSAAATWRPAGLVDGVAGWLGARARTPRSMTAREVAPPFAPPAPEAVEPGAVEPEAEVEADHDDAPQTGVEPQGRLASLVVGPTGRPFHPLLAAVAIGAWVCALGFDVISQVADTAWVYARGAYVLTGSGVVVGAIAATVGLADLVRIPRETAAFRTGVRHLLAMDVSLVLFAASFLIRRGSSFAWHEGVGVVPMGVSIVGLVALGVGSWLGLSLAFMHGVRVVAVDDERRDLGVGE